MAARLPANPVARSSAAGREAVSPSSRTRSRRGTRRRRLIVPRDIDKLAATVPSGSLVPAVRRNCEAKLTSSMEPSWAPGLKALVRRHRYDFAAAAAEVGATGTRSSGWSCRGRSSAAAAAAPPPPPPPRQKPARTNATAPEPVLDSDDDVGPIDIDALRTRRGLRPPHGRTPIENRRRRGTPRAFREEQRDLRAL